MGSEVLEQHHICSRPGHSQSSAELVHRQDLFTLAITWITGAIFMDLLKPSVESSSSQC